MEGAVNGSWRVGSAPWAGHCPHPTNAASNTSAAWRSCAAVTWLEIPVLIFGEAWRSNCWAALGFGTSPSHVDRPAHTGRPAHVTRGARDVDRAEQGHRPPVHHGQFILSCLAYPTTLDKSVTEPVVSDIPTLVYLGQLDTQTPVSWGREVAKGLSDATVVEWANQGHIAATHDDKSCAGDIAAAFLDDPSTPPDLSCAASDAYKVQFVLPE